MLSFNNSELKVMVDKKTGEVDLGFFKPLKKAQEETAREYARRNQAREFFEHKQFLTEEKNYMEKVSQQLGGFVFIPYNLGQVLNFLSPQDLLRFIYISTYIDFDGVLKRGKRIMTYEIFKDVMELSDSETSKFYTALKTHEILIEEDNKLIISKQYILRGKLPPKDENIRYNRCYVKTMKELYAELESSEHKTIGHLFKLIPFINSHNILCSNVLEEQKEYMLPLSVLDICELLKRSTDTSNMDKFMNKLYSIRIGENKMPLIINRYDEEMEKEVIWVNPKLFHSGNTSDIHRQLITLFQ